MPWYTSSFLLLVRHLLLVGNALVTSEALVASALRPNVLRVSGLVAASDRAVRVAVVARSRGGRTGRCRRKKEKVVIFLVFP